MKAKGFTLVETLISLALLSVIAGVVIVSFSAVNSSGALERSVSDVLSALNQARSLTLSSKDSSSYGVRFAETEVIIFRTSFDAGNAENISIPLGSQVRIIEVALGGASEVVFERLTGKASTAGTVTLENSASSTGSIIIHETGLSETN